MRWITRHAVFAICFSLGSTAWFVLAQKAPDLAPQSLNATQLAHQKVEMPDIPFLSLAVLGYGRDESLLPSLKFGPVEPIPGYANRNTVILRESADKGAPVVARVKMEGYDPVEILGATRDFLHVRFTVNDDAADDEAERTKHYDGWTTWDSVVPDLTAIILDTETGEVVSRVPLAESLNSVTFSPDGSRALFSHDSDGTGSAAYEVQTSDYTLTRSLRTAENNYLGTLFYGPTGGDLYAAVSMGEKVNLMRVGESGETSVTPDFDMAQSNFAVSRDGLTGFILRRESGQSDEMTVDVIDLSTLRMRNTFTLTGENFPSDSSYFVLNNDGSELYIRLSEETGLISVIDTRTGQYVRGLPDGTAQEDSYFGDYRLAGDSLLLRVWKESYKDEVQYRSTDMYWANNGGLVQADQGIDFAVGAGGRLYAVNEEGTRLFKLDAGRHIEATIVIPRPELQKSDVNIQGMSVFGFTASPDGKRLVMFIGQEHGC